MSEVADFEARYLAWSKEVQRLFAPYFPAFNDLELAGKEGDWLYFRVFDNHIPTIRHRQAKAELEKVVDALRVLARHPVPFCMRSTSPVENGDDDPVMKLLEQVQEIRESALTEAVLSRFIAHGEECIENLPDRRSINWEAVHTVDSLREWWWRNTGHEAPRTLNPASKFGKFISDGFEFLGVTANPVAAFRRWLAEAPQVP